MAVAATPTRRIDAFAHPAVKARPRPILGASDMSVLHWIVAGAGQVPTGRSNNDQVRVRWELALLDCEL